MPQLRVSLAQVNATVGDLAGNAGIIKDRATEAKRLQSDIVAFPEMVLTGYPVEDLALRPSFQAASAATLNDLAAELAAAVSGDLVCLVGYLDYVGAPVNALAVIHDGKVRARYIKHHLPNYGVFDEARYFRSGNTPVHLRIRDTLVTLAICEDLWQPGGPTTWAREAGSELIISVNASPYERHKDDVRLQLCRERSQQAGCAVAYVNLVGGQDELVFDGDSLVIDAQGKLVARAPQFLPTLLTVDLELPEAAIAPNSVDVEISSSHSRSPVSSIVAPPISDLEEVYTALVVGLRDYVDKNGFRSVLLGVSGGIDSALIAALSCDALGAERVFGVSMPSVYSSEHSRADAFDLAQRCGIHIRTVDIAPLVAAFLDALPLTGLAEENLQARVRGTVLMALSNQEGHLVLTTGNKSELSVGYSTLYGDSVGGFAPIKDVSKSLVWELARWRNSQAEHDGMTPPIPPNSIEKAPSAELRPDQKDSDSLPDYAQLDAVLEGYVGSNQGMRALIEEGFEPMLVERVLRMTDAAEYKRRQAAPGTKISGRAFGRDRRLPITNAWRESSS